MANRLVIKAEKKFGMMYIIMAPILLVVIIIMASAAAQYGATVSAPGLMLVLMVIVGIWYLNAELVVFEAESFNFKLAIAASRKVIKYSDITSVDSSNKKKIIIMAGNNKYKIMLKPFSPEDKEKILAEIKSRSGK